MGLEATMIIIDNSESSRNGDYVPTRFEAQADAVNLIFSAKTGANAESSVGLMSMGGQGPEVLTTLTTDMGKILDGIHRTKIRGDQHFATAINIASLALKHRQNRSQKQRIILFTCSAIPDDTKSLVKLAKKMKKNNINIDIIAFGDTSSETISKLEAFRENVASSTRESHLAVIPPSSNLLSDSIIATPILSGDGQASGMGGAGEGASGGGGANEFEFGVDPSMDPELALALRMSYEEEKARQAEREKKEKEEAEKSKLESVPEEGESSERQPLLDRADEASGSGAKGSKSSDKKDDTDKMDTA